MLTHICDFVEKSVLKFGDNLAFKEAYNKQSISYTEFKKAYESLACEIIRQIPTKPKQQSVLILLPKSIKCLVSLFAVARSGNFYTILDEKTPVERLKSIVKVLKPSLMISSKSLNLKLNLPTIYADDFENFSFDENLLSKLKHTDTNLLYVLFTSGSTGVPKGICVSHKSVIDYIINFCDELKLKENENWLNQTPFYFDASIRDVFASVKMGSTLHIMPNALFAFPKKILSYIEKEKITHFSSVPSVLSFYASEKNLAKFKLTSLKRVLFSGEIMPTKHFNILKKSLKNTSFFNLYGPTEITGTCSFCELKREFKDDEILPIGRAYKNTELLVFDENLKLLSLEQVGVKGELFVRGSCLSVGYYKDKIKTKKAFVQNPLHNDFTDLLYKTGDIVAYNEFGELVCYGRADNQIKYLGHRVELGEIESVINSHPKVKKAACVFEKYIYCFYESELELDIKEFLEQRVPAFMIPVKFTRFDKLKLNANGKIDRVYLRGQI